MSAVTAVSEYSVLFYISQLFVKNLTNGANAASKGVKIGRPQTTLDNIPEIFLKHYPSYKNGTLNVSECGGICGMSGTIIYKYLELLEKQKI